MVLCSMAGDAMYWWNGVVVTRSVRLGRRSSARVAWCCSEKQRNDRLGMVLQARSRWDRKGDERYGRLGRVRLGVVRLGQAGKANG